MTREILTAEKLDQITKQASTMYNSGKGSYILLCRGKVIGRYISLPQATRAWQKFEAQYAAESEIKVVN